MSLNPISSQSLPVLFIYLQTTQYAYDQYTLMQVRFL